MSLTMVTLGGTVQSGARAGLDGFVEATPSGDVVDPADSIIIRAATVRIPVVDGVVTPTPLTALDPSLVWNITENLRGVPLKSYPIQILTTDPTSVDLSSKAPVTPPTPLPGVAITNAGSAGQVLVSEGNFQAQWVNSSGGGGGVQIGGDLGGTNTLPTVISTHLSAPLPLAQGGTGAADVVSARTALGLGSAAVANSSAFDAAGAAAAVAATVPVVGAAGSGASHALSANDPTTVNARTPSAHATTHATGGSDPVTPASIGAVASGSLGGAASLNVGTTINTVAAGDDSRITGAAQKANNLSDLANAATARTSLGLGGASTLNVGTAAGTVAAGNDARITGALQASNNLSDVALAATARTNLGLGTAATQNVGAFAQTANNLSDLVTPATARTNLGLGGAAVLNVGTAASTVAAGDDSRITGAVQTAGHGLTKSGTSLLLTTPIASADLPTAATGAQGAVLVESAATVLVPVSDIPTIGASNRVAYSDHAHPLQPWQFSVLKYGAIGDLNCVVDAVTNGTAVITSASGKFTSGMVGMSVAGKGFLTSGQSTLRAKVLSFQSSTQVTLDTAATSTATGLQFVWGTNDNAAFQAAQNAALAYGNGSPFSKSVQVVVPLAPGGFGYMIDGNLTFTDGTNAVYNGQIVTGIRSDRLPGLTIEWFSPIYAGGTRHWNSDYPHFTGCSLFSTLTFASQAAQATTDPHSIANGGNPAVISGPTGKFGYGVTGTNPQFSNITMILKNISIINAHSASGWSICPFNFSGTARAHIVGCGFGTSGVVQYYTGAGGSGGNTDFANPSTFSGGASMGGLMPAAGNNADSTVEDSCWNGGFTYGPLLGEHLVCKGINRSLYSWIGVGIAGTYGDGGSGAGSLHGVDLGQFCIEACSYHVGVWGAGAAGIGPYISGTIDTEGSVQFRAVTNIAANLQALSGELHLIGSPSTPTFTFPTNLHVIKETQTKGSVATPTFTLGTAQINTYYRDAIVVVSGGTVTAIKISALAGGTAFPTMTTQPTTSGTFLIPAGCWWEIDGTVAPTMTWTLI